jgi:hypothetical protein
LEPEDKRVPITLICGFLGAGNEKAVTFIFSKLAQKITDMFRENNSFEV